MYVRTFQWRSHTGPPCIYTTVYWLYITFMAVEITHRPSLYIYHSVLTVYYVHGCGNHTQALPVYIPQCTDCILLSWLWRSHTGPPCIYTTVYWLYITYMAVEITHRPSLYTTVYSHWSSTGVHVSEWFLILYYFYCSCVRTNLITPN